MKFVWRLTAEVEHNIQNAVNNGQLTNLPDYLSFHWSTVGAFSQISMHAMLSNVHQTDTKPSTCLLICIAYASTGNILTQLEDYASTIYKTDLRTPLAEGLVRRGGTCNIQNSPKQGPSHHVQNNHGDQCHPNAVAGLQSSSSTQETTVASYR